MKARTPTGGRKKREMKGRRVKQKQKSGEKDEREARGAVER